MGLGIALWKGIRLPFSGLARLLRWATATPKRRYISLFAILLLMAAYTLSIIATMVFNNTPAGKATATARALTKTASVTAATITPTTGAPVGQLRLPIPSGTPVPASASISSLDPQNNYKAYFLLIFENCISDVVSNPSFLNRSRIQLSTVAPSKNVVAAPVYPTTCPSSQW
jgi:hypothetical protein